MGVSSGHYGTCLLFADEQAGKRKTCMPQRTFRGTDAGEKGGTTPVRGGVLRFLHGRYGAQSTTPSRDGACNVMHPFI